MARYIVISFDSNTEADMFIQDALDNKVGFYHNGDFHSYDEITVWGMYMKPTQFCECPAPGPKQSRGKKYGLWIDSCGKPIRGHNQYGRNLLVPNDVYDKLDPRLKASFLLGTRDGIELPHLPIRSYDPDLRKS